MLQAFAGEDPLDPTTRVARTDDYSRYLGKTAKGLKVGVPKAVFFDDLHPDVEKSVRAAIQIFTDLGAEVREIDLPFAQSDIDNWNTMALAEAFVVHEGHMATNAQDLAPEVSSRLELGRNISARDYLNARDHQMELQHKFAAFMEDFDVLAMPTAPIPAVSIKTGTVDVQGRQVEGAPIMGRLTRMAVFTGQPAISVPCGFTETGLPVGLQLVGHWFGEAALLGVADAYEQATLWHTMLPPDID